MTTPASTSLPGPALGEAANVSLRLRQRAHEHPDRVAIRAPDGSSCTFGELERRCDAIAHGLGELGLVAGDRACLFVRPGSELIALTHALFRARIVPVMIDPGMGRKQLLSCVERMQPRALIGVPKAHVARVLFPQAFRSVEVLVTVGRKLGWGGATLRDVERLGGGRGEYAIVGDAGGDAGGAADAEAAILFTSGSTGPPKGVVYTQAMFSAQLDALAKLYDLMPGEVDCACFPLFALFDNALGMTAVFPKMDPSRPADCDPRVIFETIESSGATFTFGSPAIWKRVVPWARSRHKSFSQLRRITIAGAPVPPTLIAGLRAMLPAGADVHTPYGATESLPVTSISGAEVTALRDLVEGGRGTCVGRPVDSIELALIRIADERFETLSTSLRVPAGEPGEVCVRGPQVTHEYKHDPRSTLRAKIGQAPGLWHRMGDIGRLDDEGRLWLLGRKSHRIETPRGTLLPVPLENSFNTLAGVSRTALVGVGARGIERPHLVVEAESGANRRALEQELRAHHPPLADASCIEGFLFHSGFPVDVRHNAKIHRDTLKRWAEEQVG